MTDEINKPPLGLPPYYIAAESRIYELAKAIERNAFYDNIKAMQEWAREIVEQCELISKMRGDKKEVVSR